MDEWQTLDMDPGVLWAEAPAADALVCRRCYRPASPLRALAPCARCGRACCGAHLRASPAGEAICEQCSFADSAAERARAAAAWRAVADAYLADPTTSGLPTWRSPPTAST